MAAAGMMRPAILGTFLFCVVLNAKRHQYGWNSTHIARFIEHHDEEIVGGIEQPHVHLIGHCAVTCLNKGPECWGIDFDCTGNRKCLLLGNSAKGNSATPKEMATSSIKDVIFERHVNKTLMAGNYSYGVHHYGTCLDQCIAKGSECWGADFNFDYSICLLHGESEKGIPLKTSHGDEHYVKLDQTK